MNKPIIPQIPFYFVRRSQTDQNLKQININSQLGVEKIVKRYKGLVRIHYDLSVIEDKLQKVLASEKENHLHFFDYQDICILYRKCFKDNDRRATALNKKMICNKEVHKKIIYVADKYAAHTEENYDSVEAFIIIDSGTNKATGIEILHNMHEPLTCKDYDEFMQLVRNLRDKISKEVKELERQIITEYNKNNDK
jgi:hypothetical protein